MQIIDESQRRTEDKSIETLRRPVSNSAVNYINCRCFIGYSSLLFMHRFPNYTLMNQKRKKMQNTKMYFVSWILQNLGQTPMTLVRRDNRSILALQHYNAKKATSSTGALKINTFSYQDLDTILHTFFLNVWRQ